MRPDKLDPGARDRYSSRPMRPADGLLFLRALVRPPPRVGALAPPGRSPPPLTPSRLTPADLPIIELGPGTGTFTEALIARGVPEDALALVEADPGFARN